MFLVIGPRKNLRDTRDRDREETLQKVFKEIGLSWVAFVGKLHLGYWAISLIHAFISETLMYLVYGVLKEAVL